MAPFAHNESMGKIDHNLSIDNKTQHNAHYVHNFGDTPHMHWKRLWWCIAEQICSIPDKVTESQWGSWKYPG